MKSDKQEIEERLKELHQVMIQGASNIRLVQYCTEKWGLKERQGRKYVQHLMKKLSELNNQTHEELLIISESRYNDIYLKCMKDGKYTDATRAQARLDKIHGLDIETVKHTGQISNVNVDLPADEEERKMIRRNLAAFFPGMIKLPEEENG